MLARSGEITAPCPVPSSLTATIPSSRTPALSHLRIRRVMRRLPIRCSTNRIFETVVAADAREPNGGLIVMPSAFATIHRMEITSLAARYRLPAVYPFRLFTELGGLLSYGNDLTDQFRRAATYANRILKGTKPSELPVEAPVKFELVINLKTAKALGLEVPPTLLARADEVIE